MITADLSGVRAQRADAGAESLGGADRRGDRRVRRRHRATGSGQRDCAQRLDTGAGDPLANQRTRWSYRASRACWITHATRSTCARSRTRSGWRSTSTTFRTMRDARCSQRCDLADASEDHRSWGAQVVTGGGGAQGVLADGGNGAEPGEKRPRPPRWDHLQRGDAGVFVPVSCGVRDGARASGRGDAGRPLTARPGS
jgi:hypothetical protein